MSQTIQFPVMVDFAFRRKRWEVCDARLAGYARDFFPEPAPTVLPIPRIDFVASPNAQVAFHVARRGTSAQLNTQGSEPAYTFVTNPDRDSLKECFAPNGQLRKDEAAWDPFELVVSFDHSLSRLRREDPWQMRREFLELENTSRALASFLTKWGDWNVGLLHEVSKPFLAPPAGLDEVPLPMPSYVRPETLWHEQEFFRNALTQKPARWLAQHAKLPSPHSINGAPYFGLTDSFCTSAIQTTITLDHLREVEYRICARDDCARPFQVQSAHGQTYCTQGCAHAVNMRRRRQAERKQSVKKAKGA